MLFALLAVSAVTPSLFIMWFFHSRDVYREPARVLWATFGLGVLTIPAVLLTVLPFSALVSLDGIANPYLGGLADAFLEAAIPEELFKFLVVYWYASRHHEFDEPMDGVVYGVAAALGFATLENVLYVSGGGVHVAVLRALTAVPGHAFAGAIMGYYVGRAEFRPADKRRLLTAALAVPILLHGAYDFPLLTLKRMAEHQPPIDAGTGVTAVLLLTWLAALVVEAVWALRATGILRREQLALERSRIVRLAAAEGREPPAPTPPSKVKGWLMVVPGFLLGGLGGLVVLGLTLGMMLGDLKSDEVRGIIVVLVVVGVLPLVVGALLFAFGLRALDRRFRHDHTVALAR